MSQTQADLRKEIERLTQKIDEGERAIMRKLDELNRMTGPTTEAKKSLLAMIDALSIERQNLEKVMRALVRTNLSD